MPFILGIDTGGTYTDAVIYNEGTKSILSKSKTFTTKHNLAGGISAVIDGLDSSYLKDISRVHLSTTLATNSLLETKKYSVAVLYLGEAPEERDTLCKSSFRIKSFVRQDGRFSPITGDVIKNIRTAFGEDIGSILVSASGCESEIIYEREAAKQLSLYFSCPIYCSYDIEKTKEHLIRTNSAIANIGLRPLISSLCDNIKTVLKANNIEASLYIMTGSGKLIPCEKAIAAPLLTIMSGPAASIAGAVFLTDKPSGLLIDMGGTSADVTKLENGYVRMKKAQTVINDKSFAAESFDIQSFAVGGDSHIYYNQMGKLCVGPAKVIPLCVASSRFSHLITELKEYKKAEDYELFTASPIECYMTGGKTTFSDLTDFERMVVSCVEKQPHSLFYISNYFGTDPDALHLNRLADKGYVQRISFTPTDLLHITGKYRQFDHDISILAAEKLAELGHCRLDDFLLKCEALIGNMLAFSCMQAVANFEKLNFDFRQSSGASYLINKFLEDDTDYLSVVFNITKPLIAVGAPVKSWMPAIAKKLGTELIVPLHHEVACAVGAAVSAYDTYESEGF